MTVYVSKRLVPLALQLVATVHDEGPDAVEAVLTRVPTGCLEAFAVALAAMVNPDARVSELLAWTQNGPVKSADWKPWSSRETVCPECGRTLRKGNLARHWKTHDKAKESVA